MLNNTINLLINRGYKVIKENSFKIVAKKLAKENNNTMCYDTIIVDFKNNDNTIIKSILLKDNKIIDKSFYNREFLNNIDFIDFMTAQYAN